MDLKRTVSGKGISRKLWVPTVLVALLLAGFGAARIREAARPALRPSASALPSASVARAEMSDLAKTIKLTAEFKPFQEVEVLAKVAGYVKAIYVDVGDRVRQGQPLAVLEIPEMADDEARAAASEKRFQAEVLRSRDDLRRAESAHQMAHLNYSRLAEVTRARPGLVAQQEVDDAQSKDLVAEAQVAAAHSAQAAAEEQVRVARAERARTSTMLAYTRVTAPFDGVVTRRYADNGSMLQAGTASQTQAMPLVRLSQNALLRLEIPVPESAVPRVEEGARVAVRVPSLERQFEGRVARTAKTLDLATRTMKIQVDVPNPKLELVPGMYAEVTLGIEERKAVVVVPLEALGGTEERPAVMVVDRNGKIVSRSVEVGLRTAERAEIRQGVEAGELVVTGGRDRLSPGQTVRPRFAGAGQGGAS